MTTADGFSGATVLITGGSGFIGSNCAHRLIAEGADVRILDAFLPGSGANPANLAGIHDRVRLVEGDVRDPSAVRAAIAGVDFVFHCAALTSHSGSMASPAETLDVNCRGTLNLLEVIKEEDASPKLIHVGTTTQIGKIISEPADEMHPEFPREMYSATMVASEKFVLLFGNARGVRTAVVRLSNTFGPRAAIHSADLGFVNYFIGLGLQDRSLTVYGDGKQHRSLLYVDDAVDALFLAALDGTSVGEVFLAPGELLTVAEIAEAVATHVGGDVTYVPWPQDRRSIDVGDAIIQGSKIHRMLGWRPKIDLPEGLRRTGSYYRAALDRYLEEIT